MHRLCSALLAALLALLAAGPALAKECKRGKKRCGDKCIPAKKPCQEAPVAADGEGGEAAAPAITCKKGKKPCGDKCIPATKACEVPAAPPPPEVKLASASSAEVEAALKSQAGQAMLQLARELQKSGDLDVTDQQRQAFKMGLRGMRPPLAICDIGHVQLVRDCDATIGGSVSLPCYLAVDEMAELCKLVGQVMPQVK